MGTGQIPFRIKLQVPRIDGYEKDELIEAAHELAAEFQTVPDASITLPLFQSKVMGLVGDREEVLASLRVIISQLTVRHSPDELKLAASSMKKRTARNGIGFAGCPISGMKIKDNAIWPTGTAVRINWRDSLFSVLNRRRNNKEDRYKKSVQTPCYVVILSDTQLIEEEPLLPLLLESAHEIDVCTIILANRKESLPMHCQLIMDASKGKGVYIKKTEDADVIQQTYKPDVISKEMARGAFPLYAPIRLKRPSASISRKCFRYSIC